MSSRSPSETPSAQASSCPVRVVLADGEGIFRASLRQLLSVPPGVVKEVYGVDIGAGFRGVGEAGSGEEIIKVVQSTEPELLLVDLSMPRMSGLEPLSELESTVGGSIPTILLATS